MQRRSWLVIASLVVCAVARMVASPADPPPNTLTAEEKAAGWKLLFDGTTMKGWRGYLKPDASGLRWTVHDGCIGLPEGGGQDTLGERDLITTDTYGDFDVRFTWKVEPGSNSGVKYFVTEDAAVRGPGGAKVGGALGHEYQVIDDERHEDAKIGTTHKTAAFYDVKAAADHPMLPGRHMEPVTHPRPGESRRALAERNEGARVRAGQPGDPSGREGEQVQGRRRVRHEGPRPHPAAGPRGCGLLQRHQDQELGVGFRAAGFRVAELQSCRFHSCGLQSFKV
jgi:hypothetical protein